MTRGEPKPCPLCGADPLAVSRHGDRDAFDIECRRCGRFTVSGTLYAISKVPDELKPRLSAYTRQCQEHGQYPEMLNTSNVQSLAESREMIAPSEKVNKLLALLARRSDHPGARTSFDTEWDYPLVDANNSEEANFHLMELKKRRHVAFPTMGTMIVTHEGWDYLQERGRNHSIPARPEEEQPRDDKEWDVFVCHASEDKEAVVEPLVRALEAHGVRVWYDRAVLTIGDSLRRKIDEGLARSQFGIVVLSPSFFGKVWPQRELDGLVQKEIAGRKVILPVWHRVSHADIARYSLPLADRVAGSTSGGIDSLADEIIRAMKSGKASAGGSGQRAAPESGVPAVVKISYKTLLTAAELHRYALTASVTLGVPPDQGRFRLAILWPTKVRISRLQNFDPGEDQVVDGLPFKELVFDHVERIFPGETRKVIGPGCPGELEYEFDRESFEIAEHRGIELRYILYLEDHRPVTGRVPFSELNVF